MADKNLPDDLRELLEEFLNKQIEEQSLINQKFLTNLEKLLSKQEFRLSADEIVAIINAFEEIKTTLEDLQNQNLINTEDILDALISSPAMVKLPPDIYKLFTKQLKVLQKENKNNIELFFKEINELTNETRKTFKELLMEQHNAIIKMAERLTNSNNNFLTSIWKQAKEYAEKQVLIDRQIKAKQYAETMNNVALHLGLIIYKLGSLRKVVGTVIGIVGGIYKVISKSPLANLIGALLKITFALPYMVIKTLGLEPILLKGINILLKGIKGILTFSLNKTINIILPILKKPKKQKVITEEGVEPEQQIEKKEITFPKERKNILTRILNWIRKLTSSIFFGSLIIELDRLTGGKIGEMFWKGASFILIHIFKTVIYGLFETKLPTLTILFVKSGLTKIITKGLQKLLVNLATKFISKELGTTIGGVLGGPVGAILGFIVSFLLEYLIKYLYRLVKEKIRGKPREKGKIKVEQSATGKLFKKPALTTVAEQEPEIVIPVPKLENIINKELERERMILKTQHTLEKQKIIRQLPTEVIIKTIPTKTQNRIPEKLTIEKINKTNTLLERILTILTDKDTQIVINNEIKSNEPKKQTKTNIIKGKIL